MFVAILLLLIFVACFASLMNSGLWSNTITLVNMITAALVATNYFEPLAEFFERNESSFAYVWDFIAMWLIFGLVLPRCERSPTTCRPFEFASSCRSRKSGDL